MNTRVFLCRSRNSIILCHISYERADIKSVEMYSPSTDIRGIQDRIITLSDRPGDNFAALVTLIKTLIGEIFVNGAYKPSNVSNGKVSMFSNEPSVKYTNPRLAVSSQSFIP